MLDAGTTAAKTALNAAQFMNKDRLKKFFSWIENGEGARGIDLNAQVERLPLGLQWVNKKTQLVWLGESGYSAIEGRFIYKDGMFIWGTNTLRHAIQENNLPSTGMILTSIRHKKRKYHGVKVDRNHDRITAGQFEATSQYDRIKVKHGGVWRATSVNLNNKNLLSEVVQDTTNPPIGIISQARLSKISGTWVNTHWPTR